MWRYYSRGYKFSLDIEDPSASPSVFFSCHVKKSKWYVSASLICRVTFGGKEQIKHQQPFSLKQQKGNKLNSKLEKYLQCTWCCVGPKDTEYCPRQFIIKVTIGSMKASPVFFLWTAFFFVLVGWHRPSWRHNMALNKPACYFIVLRSSHSKCAGVRRAQDSIITPQADRDYPYIQIILFFENHEIFFLTIWNFCWYSLY